MILDDSKAFSWLEGHLNVSRETFERLRIYRDLILKWQPALNLVGPDTIGQLWWRHIIDSAQLYPYIEENAGASLCDLGSGAGFPGMVLAIMGHHPVTLVDSDRKKNIFLKEAALATKISPTIFCERIENLREKFSIITSRACAPLTQLLEYAFPLLEKSGSLFLLKGATADTEIITATHQWNFDCKTVESLTSASGAVLLVSNISRK